MRIFLLIMLFTWIVSFIMFGIFYFREKEYKAEGLNSHLQIYNAQLLSELKDGTQEGKEYIDYVNKTEPVRFTIMDSVGVVIYDTQGIPSGTDHGNRREIIDAREKGSGYIQSRVSTSDSRQYFYSAMKNDNYIVRVSLPYDLSLAKSLQSETVYLWTILVISILLSVLAFFASRQFGQNISRLRDFATLAENGDSIEQSELDFPNDELGEISRHIINIYKKEKSASKERDDYYSNLLKEEQEKNRIKHQLTNNINHEIKTPIHAIQGCLETILENYDTLSKEQIIDFVEKGNGQVKRLCALMDDISIITRITDAPNQIKTEEVDIISILDEIKAEIETLPNAKQMRINFCLPKALQIRGNKNLIESVFRNLVSNSIIHSGGRDIFIFAEEVNDETYIFSFSDNGIGVSEEHFTRIFERFYRVDDGRSRKLGGTGLGLSIVKNAVHFHGGSIKVQQRSGGGLEFIFTLKK